MKFRLPYVFKSTQSSGTPKKLGIYFKNREIKPINITPETKWTTQNKNRFSLPDTSLRKVNQNIYNLLMLDPYSSANRKRITTRLHNLNFKRSKIEKFIEERNKLQETQKKEGEYIEVGV
jgi:hypothetical protein